MPAQKRNRTIYPGVYYIEGKAVGTNVKERIFYVMYRKDGKQIHEKVGRQYQDDMTAARAANVRVDRIQGKELSNREKRAAEEVLKKAEEGKWTIDRLFNSYVEGRKPGKSLLIDKGRYEKYIKSQFADKEPSEIVPLDVNRLRISLLKKLSAQSVKHILNLLTWIANYGVKNHLSSGLSFHVRKPQVNNEKTEDLSPDQLASLVAAIEKDSNIQAANMMKMALFTGMRRGEMFKLQWKHIDFERSFINIIDPKGGPDQRVPLNDAARSLLESHERTVGPYVFPGRNGHQRTDIKHQVNRIKNDAGLPKDFRALHGLRHVYASMLASSGEVDMYTLQKLLTHKSPLMTQRYAHLRDETLKRASDLAGSIIEQATNGIEKKNVVNLEDHKK